MNAYNSPKAQMERYKKAGLSPYLIYGQGTPGNMTSPIPAQESGLQDISEYAKKGVDDYISTRDKNQAYRTNTITQDIVRYDLDSARYQRDINMSKADMAWTEQQRKSAEFFADFPEYVDRLDKGVTPQMVTSSYRNKMNELKRAAAKSSVDRLNLLVQDQGYKNTVDRVKANYAKDYGMVGGDWTQGLGLIKSIPSFIRSGARSRGKISMPSKR